jgi:hypothetical protein
VALNVGDCQCATFDHTGTIRVASPTGTPVGNSPYAITAWIKTTSSGSLGIVGWGTYGGNDSNAFRTVDAGLLNYWYANDLYYGAPGLTDGNWHFVVAQFDGSTRSLWLDGVGIGQDSPGSVNTVAAVNFTLGSTLNGGEPFLGSIDEIVIYTGALTSQQIATLFAAGR